MLVSSVENTVARAEDTAFIPRVSQVANSQMIDFAHCACSLLWADIATDVQIQDSRTSYLLV